MIKTSINLSEKAHKGLKYLSKKNKISMSRQTEIAFMVYWYLDTMLPSEIKHLRNQIKK